MNTFPLDTLTEVNIDDLLHAWGLDQVRFGRGLLRRIARPFAKKFAKEMLKFDWAVGEGELHGGGISLIRRYAGGVQASGREYIPDEGPVLILSNHPGLSDTIALFSSIPRLDLRVIALDRPFLQALPNTAQRLFMLPDEAAGRMKVTRNAATYIKNGGAVLTFPGGHIEPDPLVLPGSIDALANWSESIGIFARLVPDMIVIVAIVGDVITPAAYQNPLTRLRRKPADQELLGASLQAAWGPYQRNLVSVVFSPPLYAQDLLAQGKDPAKITSFITDTAKKTIQDWPKDWELIVRGKAF